MEKGTSIIPVHTETDRQKLDRLTKEIQERTQELLSVVHNSHEIQEENESFGLLVKIYNPHARIGFTAMGGNKTILRGLVVDSMSEVERGYQDQRQGIPIEEFFGGGR